MVDWDRVTQLRAEIGEADFEAVVTLFLAEVAEVAEKLRHAPDPATMDADLHFLKGTVLNLGMHELGRLCDDGTERAARGEPVDLDALLDCYDESRRMLLSGLGRSE